MKLLNSLLTYLQPSDKAVFTRRNPTTSEIREAADRNMEVRCSINYHSLHRDPAGERFVWECLDEIDEETPRWVLNRWANIREAGEESKVYTLEMQRTLVSLWERWSDKEAVEKEFAFLLLNGRWHGELSGRELDRVPAEPVLEGLKMWLEKRRRSRQ